jgi:type II secretory pathway pseudopilin PulG
MELFDLAKKKNKPRVSNDAGLSLSLGFTLVEALAVVAIVGFLASIIMVNVGNSKKQGKDAAVRSAMLELRIAAELYFNDNSTYADVCDGDDLSDDGNFGRLKTYINNHNGDSGETACVGTDEGYAVISSLNMGDCWCVDYQGNSKKVEPGGDCSDELVSINCP